MDNYLSHRWPEAPPPGWTPERPAPPRPRRRVLRSLAVAALLLLLVGGVALGGWRLAHTVLERLAQGPEQSQPARSQYPESAPDGQDPDYAGEAVGALPRAEHGLGVELELDGTLTRPLSASAIYELAAPSVVSVYSRTADGGGAGSGVVMREDGYVLTNFHVIQDARAVTVMVLPSGESYDASLVGYDEDLDIAVLKIDAQGLTAARFGDSDALRVGDPAYAIGNPMGYLYGTMTDGIISYTDRLQTIDGTEMTLIQTTALLNSGNSGGALINERGQVVGITVAKIGGRGSYGEVQVEGLGFAIPISLARPFIDHILDTGESWKPTMGILCYAGQADGETGIVVKEITPGGPAELAGFAELDLILTANGRPVESVYALRRVLADAGVGGEVVCEVLRDGERLELALTLTDSALLPS